MKLGKLFQFSLIAIFALGAIKVSAADEQEADRILQEEILPTLQVEVRDGENTIQSNSKQEVLIHTKKYIGLEGFLESDTNSTYIEFSGKTVSPETVITIIFPSTFVRSSTMSDPNGYWSVQVPIDQLSAGRHQAMIQTIHQGVRSEEALVAEFDVDAEEALSNSTWVFLFSSILAILCLLFAITLQLRHNMRGFSSDPLM